MAIRGRVPDDARRIRLCKMFGEDLRLCEAVGFTSAGAVQMYLNRAAIAGSVVIGSDVELETYWADILDASGSMVTNAALDADSFRSLKNHWMRCKYETYA